MLCPSQGAEPILSFPIVYFWRKPRFSVAFFSFLVLKFDRVYGYHMGYSCRMPQSTCQGLQPHIYSIIIQYKSSGWVVKESESHRRLMAIWPKCIRSRTESFHESITLLPSMLTFQFLPSARGRQLVTTEGRNSDDSSLRLGSLRDWKGKRRRRQKISINAAERTKRAHEVSRSLSLCRRNIRVVIYASSTIC